jgi:hypothetical protein
MGDHKTSKSSTIKFTLNVNNLLALILPENVKVNIYNVWARIAQSVWQLTAGWTVRGSNPSEVEIFHTHQDQPWGPPSFLYNRYRTSFLGVKQLRCGINHPLLSSAKVKETVEL